MFFTNWDVGFSANNGMLPLGYGGIKFDENAFKIWGELDKKTKRALRYKRFKAGVCYTDVSIEAEEDNHMYKIVPCEKENQDCFVLLSSQEWWRKLGMYKGSIGFFVNPDNKKPGTLICSAKTIGDTPRNRGNTILVRGLFKLRPKDIFVIQSGGPNTRFVARFDEEVGCYMTDKLEELIKEMSDRNLDFIKTRLLNGKMYFLSEDFEEKFLVVKHPPQAHYVHSVTMPESNYLFFP